MAINKYMKAALRAISYGELDIKTQYETSRKIREWINPPRGTRELYNVWDDDIVLENHSIPVRIFEPKRLLGDQRILFFHGGGWVQGNINTYTRTCAMLANDTGRQVLSVDYRLAPEYPFPEGLLDCYEVTKILHNQYARKNNRDKEIILMGDSAGANIAAAVSLLARDKGEFSVARQILLYPATYNYHDENSPFPSIYEKGEDYLLTSQRICDYIDLYIKDKEDFFSPYFAPLLAEDLSQQPDTLLITAEHDPLRDEGEAYGNKLREFGNDVTIIRMKNALHGYFNLPIKFVHVRRTIEAIINFLE